MDIEYMDLLTELIINNTKLSYMDNDKLTIDNEAPILEVLKVIAKNKYENRIEDLKNKKENEKI